MKFILQFFYLVALVVSKFAPEEKMYFDNYEDDADFDRFCEWYGYSCTTYEEYEQVLKMYEARNR